VRDLRPGPYPGPGTQGEIHHHRLRILLSLPGSIKPIIPCAIVADADKQGKNQSYLNQAALYHFYGIEKKLLEKKLFGVFKHRVLDRKIPLVRGFDDLFPAPHSRYMHIDKEDIFEVKSRPYREIIGCVLHEVVSKAGFDSNGAQKLFERSQKLLKKKD